jgi:hypothetical protein
MNLVIFFGGILLGFLLGFTLMALLAVSSYQNQCEELAEVSVYGPPDLGDP